MLSIRLVSLFDYSLEVRYRIIEPVQGEVEYSSQEEDGLVLGAVLKGSVQVLLCIFQHLHFGLWLDRLIDGVFDDAHCSQEVRVSLLGLLLRRFREESDRVLELFQLQILEALAQNHIVVLRVIQLLDLRRLQEILQALVVLLQDDVPVGSVDKEQGVDVVLFISDESSRFVWRSFRRLPVRFALGALLRFVVVDLVVDLLQRLSLRRSFHPVDNLGEELDPSLSLPFHEKDNSLCEQLVVLELPLPQVEVRRPLKIIIGFVEIFVLNLDLGNFVES